MKLNFLSSLVLILSTGSCFVSAITLAEQFSKETLNKLEQQLVENKQRYGSVSQSIIVKKQKQVIYQKAYGLSSLELSTPVNENNMYPMYSLAKLFTSITLMSLVEQGEIDLDKSITFYLPTLPKRWAEVSVRHCLNHTSGIPEYFSMEYVQTGFPNSLNDVFSRLADKPFQFTTGDKNYYNNTNFLVIGAIIEKVTKHTYLDMVKKTVMVPLKLNQTFYAQAKEVIPNLVSSYWGNKGGYTVDKGVNWPEYSFTHSALYSNKADLQRFIDGVVDGKIVSKDTLYNMWQPMKLNNGKIGRYASGWEYFKAGDFIRVGHEGGNRVRLDYHFNSKNKSENYTSIYLTNGSGSSNGITTHLVDGLMAIISPKDFPTLVLQEKLLDGAFNKTLNQSSKALITEISNSLYITKANIADFITERGYTLYYAAQPSDSIELFEFYSQHFPKDAMGWNRLGEAWLASGEQKKAIKYFRKALSVDGQLTDIEQKIERLLHSEVKKK